MAATRYVRELVRRIFTKQDDKDLIRTNVGSPLFPTATVAAAGTVQGDAAQLAEGFTLVTGANNAGVRLPAAAAGKTVILKSTSAGTIRIWPATGDAINAIAANGNYTMATLTSCMLVAYDSTTWYSIPLVAS